jgi:hypothetical protein
MWLYSDEIVVHIELATKQSLTPVTEIVFSVNMHITEVTEASETSNHRMHCDLCHRFELVGENNQKSFS